MKKIGFMNWVDNVNWSPSRDSKADVLSFSPFSERNEDLLIVWLLYRKMELRYWFVHGDGKIKRIN